jgi:hypothetical protein
LRINLSIDYNITIRRDSGLLEQSDATKPDLHGFSDGRLLVRSG